MTDFANKPIDELAELIHSGEVSSREVVSYFLDRIKTLGLASTAHVMGDVRSTKLVIAEGATFVGNCHVTPDALKAASEFVTPVAATPIKK